MYTHPRGRACATGQNHTFSGSQTAGTGRGAQEDSERQHKAVKLHFTAAGSACLPSTSQRAPPEPSRGSTLFLQPTLPQAFSPLPLCQLSTDRVTPHPDGAGPPESPAQPPDRARRPSAAGAGAGAARPLCSRGEEREPGTAAGGETLPYFIHTHKYVYIYVFTVCLGFFFPATPPSSTGSAGSGSDNSRGQESAARH